MVSLRPIQRWAGPGSVLLATALLVPPRLPAQQDSAPVETGWMEPANVTEPGGSETLPVPSPKRIPRRRSNRPMPPLPVGSPGKAPPLPRGPEVRIQESPGNSNPQTAVITTFKNTAVTPAGASRSSVGEPTASHIGFSAFYTGNWYAAVSSNDGSTWSYINPFRKFPSIDGGFCCDQYSLYVPKYRMIAWLLQYGYSTTTRKNSYRIAIAKNEANLRAGVWHYYTFNPQSFGIPLGYELDFPHMAISNNYLFVTANVFLGPNQKYTVIWRMPLLNLSRGSGFSYQYYKTPARTWRLTQGATSTMYWWQHVTTTSERLFIWPETASSITWKTISVSSWAWGARGKMIAKGPLGRNFMARADSRPLAAWVSNGVIGVMWHAMQGGSFPYPYTRVVEVNQSNYTVKRQSNMWSSAAAIVYPCISRNARGHLGGMLGIGGPKYYPGTVMFIVDDLAPNFAGTTIAWAATGNNSPSRQVWGDYLTTIPHSRMTNTWVGSAMSQVGGSSNSYQIPRYVHFGRSRDKILKPDLVPLSVQANSTRLYQGSTYTFNSRIKNEGTTAAPLSYNGYYLSTNSFISTFDTLIASFTMPTLPVGGSLTNFISARVPAAAPVGSVYLGVLADRLNRIAEWSESNNAAARPVTCVGRPDLVVSYATNTTTALAGTYLRVTTTTTNMGVASAPSSRTGILLSRNKLITTYDDLLGYYSTGTLAPKRGKGVSASYRIPICTTGGTHYLGAIADVDGTVAESSETNNSRLGNPVTVYAYTGTGKYIEFGAGYQRSDNTSLYQTISGRTGGIRPMCVLAPKYARNWYILIWSGNPSAFKLDLLGYFSLSLLNSPFFANWLGRTDTQGRARPSFSIPKGTIVLTAFHAYTYSLWFDRSFKNFLGFGSNRLDTYIYP